ncbi:MAG: efflux RND transporter periplasmic adaptor subunit [Phenylobacterium sp.]|uniref:efflux RND transporter periplasmic adaptor subunit n=1 Tax=Phenylobacterium sp. TaxID=1871053 RepID=UPI0027221496|nr:efflux RND transporter periplasmic adaptor subunit [Phenylobacterium sp.]MDO9431266.1 efflux RND transporter periplasmic adaptor subunit [Phenylobacterium sp.]
MSAIKAPRRRQFACAVVALTFISLGACSGESEGQPEPKATPVRVAKAAVRPLAIEIRAIGSVTPLHTVEVRSQAPGQLTRVLFTEGQEVRQGQLLAEIDPAPFRAKVDEVQGQKQQNEAQLRYAERQLEIYQGLAEKQILAQTRLDQQRTLVDQHGGAVAADQARLADARIQLGRTRIVAPVSGRIGMRRADPGNVIGTSATDVLAVITQTRPISVLFSAPESRLPEIRAAIAAGRPLSVQAWDRTEKILLAEGRLTSLDNQIDPQTGAVRIRAVFPNADEVLFPNQFVNVRLTVSTLNDAVTVPDAAIQQGSRGTYAWIADAKGEARMRQIKIGPSNAGWTAVLTGLNAGDRVVVEGLDRLSEGSPVEVIAKPDTQAVQAQAPTSAS